MKKIVLASNNLGKAKEIKELLQDLPIELILQKDLNIPEIPETGETFIENAIIKARHASQLSGLPAIADDSGLAVDALGGAPGVYSARFAGANATDNDRNQKLLTEMIDVDEQHRGAHYHAVTVLLRHSKDPAPFVCDGVWYGKILREPHGKGGFGYDPVFFVESHHCSAAELAPETKNKISHRAKALQKLITEIKNQKDFFENPPEP